MASRMPGGSEAGPGRGWRMWAGSARGDHRPPDEGKGADPPLLSDHLVELSGVRKAYGDNGEATVVVDECSFVLRESTMTVLIGPSGCGKTTLAYLIAGYESPTDGAVMIDSRRVTGPGPDRLLLFQESALYPWLTTYENVMFGPRARGEDGPEARRRADALLSRVGLGSFAQRYPSQLSGGMQRRAELARAFMNSPRLLIMDEPFRGLDAMTRGLMQEYYAEIFAERNGTGLFITTDIDEAVLLADVILVMANRPTRVSRQIEVELPRPRNRELILTDPRAYEIKRMALDTLYEEAAKGFEAGDRTTADFMEAYATHTRER